MQIIYFIFKVDWRCVNKWGVLILRGKGVPSLSHTFTGYVAFSMGSLLISLLVSVKCNDNQKVPGTVSPIRVVLDFTIITLLVFCEPKNFVP